MSSYTKSGIIEVFLLLAVFAVSIVYGVAHNSSEFKMFEFSSAMTRKNIPSPTTTPDPIRFDRAVGIGMTDELTLQVQLNGQRTDIPLLGITIASSSADCIQDPIKKEIIEKVRSQQLYMIYYENTPKIHGVYPRYIFLEDGSSLNGYVLAQGLGQATTETHPYLADFTAAQDIAHTKKLGIWNTLCNTEITPIVSAKTVSPFIVQHLASDTPTPSLTPAQSTPVIVKNVYTTPTLKPTTIVKTPTPLPPVNLMSYLTSTASATVTPVRSLNSDHIFDFINNYRQDKKLPLFERDTQLCALASSRAPELYNEIFVSGHVHEGFYSRNIPYWITENMASYPTEQQIVNWWLNSSVHRAAIESTYKYSCGACSGTSCTQLFTSFVSK